MVSGQDGSGHQESAGPAAAVEGADPSRHQEIADGANSITDQALVDRINRSDRWLIFLTAAIAFSGVVSAIIFGRQLSVMQGQLDEMHAEQRPWVYANSVTPAGHIILTDGRYVIPLKFSITNTGHLPAFFVTPTTSAAVIAVGSGSTLAIRNDVCNDYRNSADKIGTTVFPGQTVSHGGFTAGDYPSVPKSEWDAIAGPKMLIVFGCIDYQFPTKPGHHQSRFAFAVGKLADQGILKRLSPFHDDRTAVDIGMLPITIGDSRPTD